VEIFIQREQRVRLQFSKNSPEFLFNPIDGMEEVATVHAKFARAQLPVRSQKKMIAEDTIFGLV
jgi:hypothetical protein